MANVTATISDKELDKLFRKLEALKGIFSDSDFEKVISEAAIPAQSAMQKTAPKSKKTHAIKVEGGGYKNVKPGNLQRSIQIFKAKKQKSKTVLVGSILSKKSRVKSAKGVKRISRAKNAFYSNFVLYGTMTQAPNRFVERARTSSKSAVVSKLKEGAIKYARTEVKDIFK